MKKPKSQKLAFLRRSANSRQNSKSAMLRDVTGISSQISPSNCPVPVSRRACVSYAKKIAENSKTWEDAATQLGLRDKQGRPDRRRAYLIATGQRPPTETIKRKTWATRKKNFMRFVKRVVMPLLERKQTLSPSHAYTRGGVPAEGKW